MPYAEQLPSPRPFSLADRLFITITCVNPKLLASCPEDASNVRKLALLMWLCWGWQSLLFANCSRIMLSETGEWGVPQIAIAVLLATIVLLADATIFIAPSWHTHGLAEVGRLGYRLPQTKLDKLKNFVPLIARFTAALLIANLMAVVTGLSAFQNDIRKEIDSIYLSQNADVIASASKRANQEIADNQALLDEFRRQIGTQEGEARTLRATIVNPSVEDPEIKLALEEFARAETNRTSAHAGLKEATDAAADEVDGTCRPGRSCMAGEGPKWRAAQARIANASNAKNTADEAYAVAQRRVRTVQERKATELQRQTTAAEFRLQEVLNAKAMRERELAALVASHEKLAAGRDQKVQAMIAADPRRVPREEGLLARLKALRTLMQDPSVSAMVWLLDGFFMMLELSAVCGKLISLIPMAYATQLVESDLVRAKRTIKRLNDEDATPSKPEPTPPSSPPPTPSPAVEVRPIYIHPTPPAPETRRRPAGGRWKPPGVN